jgi:cell division protease FtsH
MVARFGMDPNLGQVSYESEPSPLLGASTAADWHPRRYAEQTAAAIDNAVRGMIDVAFKSAVAILNANRAILEQAATTLLAKETMSGDDLRAVAERVIPASIQAPSRVGLSIAATAR